MLNLLPTMVILCLIPLTIDRFSEALSILLWFIYILPLQYILLVYCSTTCVHCSAIQQVLSNLRRTITGALFLSWNSSLSLWAYSESGYVSDIIDQRSTTSFCIFLGSSLTSWKSKRQSAIPWSSAEVEQRALAHAAFKHVCLWWLLKDMIAYIHDPTPLYSNNKMSF